MIHTVIGVIIWLAPLLIYLFLFSDPPEKRVLWGIVTFLFSWVGLLVRVVYGLIGGR